MTWWRGLDLGRPGDPASPAATESDHLERCPFCGRMFDLRDLVLVCEHYNHQLAAGAPPTLDLTPDSDGPPTGRRIIPRLAAQTNRRRRRS
jgi:hypothetical protein